MINQLDFENFFYLRNSQLLKYLTASGKISGQRGVAEYNKWSTYDSRWTKRGTTFKDIQI